MDGSRPLSERQRRFALSLKNWSLRPKRNDLHSRRLAIAFLRQKDAVAKLFAEVAPNAGDRQGGYCRITKLGQRMTDAAPMAIIEWVDLPELGSEDEIDEVIAEETPEVEAKKPAKKAAEKKEEEPATAEAE